MIPLPTAVLRCDLPPLNLDTHVKATPKRTWLFMHLLSLLLQIFIEAHAVVHRPLRG